MNSSTGFPACLRAWPVKTSGTAPLRTRWPEGSGTDRLTEGTPRAQDPGPGLHWYFFQVIALKDRVDQRRLGWPATVEQMSHAIEGKAVGWGRDGLDWHEHCTAG